MNFFFFVCKSIQKLSVHAKSILNYTYCASRRNYFEKKGEKGKGIRGHLQPVTQYYLAKLASGAYIKGLRKGREIPIIVWMDIVQKLWKKKIVVYYLFIGPESADGIGWNSWMRLVSYESYDSCCSIELLWTIYGIGWSTEIVPLDIFGWLEL